MLFEHSVGYVLLSLKEVEETSLLLPQVEECVPNLGRFHSVVRLVAFCPFSSSQVALGNASAVSEGVVHEDLRLLLETYLPSNKKKVLLGVGDPKVDAAIQEELGYNCQTGGVIAEILRGKNLYGCQCLQCLQEPGEGDKRAATWVLEETFLPSS